MNRQELAALIALRTANTKEIGETTVNAIIDSITEALAVGDKVVLSGFGGFEIKELSARQGRNPRTGEPIEITASKSVSFKPGKALRDNLN